MAACVLVVTLIVTGRSARSDRVVNVCSWGEYIDESLITQFEEESRIRVNYQTAESNEALYLLNRNGRRRLRCHRPLGLYDRPAH